MEGLIIGVNSKKEKKVKKVKKNNNKGISSKNKETINIAGRIIDDIKMKVDNLKLLLK